MDLNKTRLDAAQTVFFTRQLEEIDATMYDVKYADLEAFQLVPVKSDMHPGTDSYTYRMYDAKGVATMTSNYAGSSPRADVSGQEFTSRVRGIRNSYGYNVQEIRAAAKENFPLDSARAIAARRVMNEKVNRTALLGDAEHQIVGLFNQPNAQTYTIPANGTGASKKFADKTTEQVLDDLFGFVDQIPTVTNEIEKPTRVLMPYPVIRALGRRLVGAAAPGVSILKFFQEQRPGIEVRGALFLNSAGAGGVGRMMAYDPKPENMQLLVPIAFESFPPQQNGLEFVIENHARMGGVVVRFPMSMIYADGIC